MSRPKAVGWILVLALTAGMALAAEMSGKGESIIVAAEPKETPLPEGGTFVELENRQVLLADDGEHPFHHVAMTCSGNCRGEGEALACAGGCSGVDRDGDVITFSWDGYTEGGWKLQGGTGKWAGSSGSGTWKAADPMGSGFTRNTWSGTIRMN